MMATSVRELFVQAFMFRHNMKEADAEAEADAWLGLMKTAGLKVVGQIPTEEQNARMEALLGAEGLPPTKRWHWVWDEMWNAAPPSPTQGEKK